MEQIEQLLTSMEVSEMVEKEHKNLLRDIKRYCDQIKKGNEESNQLKVEPVRFFQESSYIDEKGETRQCYNITKSGCEFIGHKMTGVKGTMFTARYIERFHQMQSVIEQAQQLEEQRKQTEATQIMQHSSTLLLPVADEWFKEMNQIFEDVCNYYNWSRKRLYHEILNELGDIYDLNKSCELYQIETGHKFNYIMDVVEYFPQLRNEAVRIANKYAKLTGFTSAKVQEEEVPF